MSASVDKVDGEVRVRFAPSPTGNLHVGGARTALFNYLFARFVLLTLPFASIRCLIRFFSDHCAWFWLSVG